jgi:hypothetical protein
MKTKKLLLAIIFLYAVALAGCAGRSFISHSDIISLANEERAMLKQASLALEQRTFDVSEAKLIKALVNGLSNKGLIVQTLEKDAGFIMAEGSEILDYNSLLSVRNERNTRWWNSSGGKDLLGRGYALPDVILKVTVNFYSKGAEKTLVKMKINSVVQACMYPLDGRITKPSRYLITNCPPSPTMVSLWYQQLWDEIEKSIFMQRETILN